MARSLRLSYTSWCHMQGVVGGEGIPSGSAGHRGVVGVLLVSMW